MVKFRNFLITFLISLLVFGAVAYFGMQAILEEKSSPVGGETEETIPGGEGTSSPDVTGPSSPETTNPSLPETTSSDPEETTDPEEKTGSFTFLFVGTDYQPDVFDDYRKDTEENEDGLKGLPDGGREINADSFLLLRVNKEKNTFLFSSLSPNMKVSNLPGVTVTLADSFRQNGIEKLCENIFSLTGLTVDYYASVSMSDCALVFDAIGGLSFNVPCDMYYSDPDQNLEIDLKKGVQSLSGEDAVKMLRFNSYPTSSNSRLTVAIDLMKTILAKVTQPTFLPKAEELYVTLTELIETNFTSDDLLTNVELFSSYKDYTKATVTYPTSKEHVNGKEVLAPDIKSALTKYGIYK